MPWLLPWQLFLWMLAKARYIHWCGAMYMYLWAYNCVHLKSCEHLLWIPLICRAKVLNCWSGWTLLFNLIHQSWGKDTRSNWRRMDTTLCWHLIVNHVIVIAVRSYSGELVSMAINAKVCFMYSLLRQNYVLINVYTAMYICKNICLFPLTVCEYNVHKVTCHDSVESCKKVQKTSRSLFQRKRK